MSKIHILVSLMVFSLFGVPSHGMQLNLPGKIMTIAFTPFDDKGKLNLAIVPQMAKYYSDNNLTNIFVLGYDGGGGTLLANERKALVEAWTEQARCYGLNIIVEVGLQPFFSVLSLASYCNEKNVAAITHIPEQIYEAETIEEVIVDMRRVSEAAPNIPLIYNELLSSTPEVTADEVFLAGDQVPTFCGVETTMNTYYDIEAVTSTGNKTVLIYDIQYMYDAFLQGLKCVSLGPNLSPSIVKEMEAAANSCDRDTAKQLQNKLNSWVAAICNLDGGTINTYSRSKCAQDSFNIKQLIISFTPNAYSRNLRIAFQMITGIPIGLRVPFEEANSTEYGQIASNLRSLGVPLAGSVS